MEVSQKTENRTTVWPSDSTPGWWWCSVAKSCPVLCDPTDCSTPGLPVLHRLPEFTQTQVHWVSDAIQPSHPLSSPSPPAFNLSQHQGLFQRVGFFSTSEYVPENKTNPLIWKDTCTPELMAALFTVTKIGKQPAWLPHLMLLTTLGWALVFPAFCRWRHGLREAGGLSGAGQNWGFRLGIPTGACAPPRRSCAPAVVSGSHRWDATSPRRHHAGAPCLVTWSSSSTYQAPVLALGQSRWTRVVKTLWFKALPLRTLKSKSWTMSDPAPWPRGWEQHACSPAVCHGTRSARAPRGQKPLPLCPCCAGYAACFQGAPRAFLSLSAGCLPPRLGRSLTLLTRSGAGWRAVTEPFLCPRPPTAGCVLDSQTR